MRLIFPLGISISVFLAPSVAEARGNGSNGRADRKIDVCHLNGDGAFQVLNVSANAWSGHEGHGDQLTGAWYPDTDGDGLGEDSAAPVDCPADGLVDNVDDTCVATAEVEDGLDNDCDGWVDEDFVCPCYDAADLDGMLAGLSTYALGWANRADGLTDVTSLRGYFWFQDSDGIWKSPTLGADVYRTASDDAPHCEVWSATWLAAPYHAWAGDDVSDSQAIAEESVGVCESVLDDWIIDNGVPLTTW